MMSMNYQKNPITSNDELTSLFINKADINLTQLNRNVSSIKDKLKAGVKFMAVVKANAYGHGLVEISSEMENIGCDYLGVARLSEAIQLRNNGIMLPILVLTPIIPHQADVAIKNNITLAIDNLNAANNLNKIANEIGLKVNIHIKVNTGLNRYGCNKLEVIDFIKYVVKNCPNLNIEGIFTHFRDGEYDKEFTEFQIKEFNTLINQLENESLRPPIVHAAGSSGILLYPESHYDMVRCGLILYGLELLEDQKCLPEGIKPIMTLKSCILKIRNIKSGEYSGYGNGFKMFRDGTIAVVGIGYGDGVSRKWKEVLIAGQKLPVVNYCMDSIIVDITDSKVSIKEFDEVVIVGTEQGETISWEQACKGINMSTDEQLQRITERVYRNYYHEF